MLSSNSEECPGPSNEPSCSKIPTIVSDEAPESESEKESDDEKEKEKERKSHKKSKKKKSKKKKSKKEKIRDKEDDKLKLVSCFASINKWRLFGSLYSEIICIYIL